MRGVVPLALTVEGSLSRSLSSSSISMTTTSERGMALLRALLAASVSATQVGQLGRAYSA